MQLHTVPYRTIASTYVGIMKTKRFALFVLTTFLITDAAEVTDDNINSLLVSYLRTR